MPFGHIRIALSSFIQPTNRPSVRPNGRSKTHWIVWIHGCNRKEKRKKIVFPRSMQCVNVDVSVARERSLHSLSQWRWWWLNPLHLNTSIFDEPHSTLYSNIAIVIWLIFWACKLFIHSIGNYVPVACARTRVVVRTFVARMHMTRNECTFRWKRIWQNLCVVCCCRIRPKVICEIGMVDERQKERERVPCVVVVYVRDSSWHID